MKIKIICACGHEWTYSPRDPNKIPKRPNTTCSRCGKRVIIKRSKLIDSDNYTKITQLKLPREKLHTTKLVCDFEILKFLDQGFYAQKISQKLGISKGNLSRIITSFKSRGLIEQIQSYPKSYKLSDSGTLILAQGDLNQKRISEFVSDKRTSPKGMESLRVHKLRFKNKLVQKPSYLNKITNQGRIFGLTIKKLEMNNWDKYLIYFNYDDFNGLDNIEICNNVIIYNFDRNIEEQFVSTPKELDDYIDDLISNCKQARSFLQEKGFIIDEKDPVFCQNPHFAVASDEDANHIGKLGKDILLTVKTPTETREIDHSPPSKGKGEEETDSIEKAKSYLNMPDELENIKADIMKINDRITEMSSQMATKNDISEIVNTMKIMTTTMNSMVNAISELAKSGSQKQKTDAKTTPAPEGIYQ